MSPLPLSLRWQLVSGLCSEFPCQVLPCSVMKPACKSCRLYNGGRIANNQVAAMLVSASFAQCDFARQLLRFVTSSAIHLHSSLTISPDPEFSGPFLLPFTTAALQLLQRGAVWQVRLYSLADTSSRLAPAGLYHLHYSMLKNISYSLSSRHKQRRTGAKNHIAS